MTERRAPDVDQLARSMLVLHGGHPGHDHPPAPDEPGNPPRPADPAATRADAQRYLSAGLVAVDCRFCHATVAVKKLGPGHTAVQWNSEASGRCAYFAELREAGTDPSRARGCPRLADSIKHAVAEGCLEEVSSATPPGDG